MTGHADPPSYVGGERDAFIAEFKERSLDDLGPLEVHLVGWRGIEGKDVVVEVRDQKEAHLYELISPDMAARIVQKEGLKYNKYNFLLMHAVGANTGGQCGSVMAAAIMLSVLQGMGII